MHAPQEHHWKVVKQILRYVVGTIVHGLHLHPSSTSSIMGFNDSDWATDLDDRHSTIGYCLLGKESYLMVFSKTKGRLSEHYRS